MKLSKTIIAVLLSVLIVLPMLACTASTGTQTQTPATSASTQASTSASTSTAPTQASTSAAPNLPTGLVVAVTGEILNIDPQVAGETTSEIIRQHMYDFLVNMNLKGEIEPSLAKSWETSADGKTWTFHLRNDVKFHDGTPFNAQAVKTTFDRIINKQYGATVSYDFEMLTAANVVDDYTVQLVTSHPTGNFLNVLTYGGGAIISPKALENYKEKLATNDAGTGPYKLKEMVSGDYAKVEANPDYWGEKPKINEITFKTVKEESTRVTMVMTGEAGFAQDIPAQELDNIKNSGKADIRQDDSNRVCQIGFNLNKKPFDNVKVRQALNYAVDKDAIIKGVMAGAAVKTDCVIAPSTWGYTDAVSYPYDPVKAKQLLTEAGYPNGFSAKIWTPQGRYFRDKETILAAADQLKAVGVNLEVEVIDWGTYLDAVRVPDQSKNKVQAYMFGWETYTREAGYAINTLFVKQNWPPQGWNTMFYTNSKVEELNTQASQEVDSTKRLAYLQEALKLIMQDAPWIPLFTYKQFNAQDKKLKGVVMYPTQIPRFEKAYFE